MPVVEVAFVIWPKQRERIMYLEKSLRSLREGLTAPGFQIVWTCNAESERVDESWFGDELAELCDREHVGLHWNPCLADLGRNMNCIFERTTADYVFITQDDHVLKRDLDLMPGLILLLRRPRIVSVWYDWLPHTHSLWGRIGEFRMTSPISQMVLADRGMLLRSNFQDVYGRFREGGPFGVVEMDLNRKLKRLNAMVACSTEPHFDDIGGVRTLPVEERYFG